LLKPFNFVRIIFSELKMRESLRELKEEGRTVVVSNRVFPEVFNKTVKCRIKEVNGNGAYLVPVGRRGKPREVSFRDLEGSLLQ
jgi:hypothetical protein